MIQSTDNITFRVRSVGPGESDYSSNATGTADTSFIDSGYTTGLSISGDTLNWTQTNSQDLTSIWVRPVGTTAWNDFLDLSGNINTASAVPLSWIFNASGVQVMVETSNTSGPANDSFSNIVTEYPQNAITAPEITSVTPTTVGGVAGLLFTYTDSTPTATYALYDASGTYVGPAVDPELGSTSQAAGTTSAFYPDSTLGVPFYPSPSGKFVMVATDSSGSSAPSNVVDISMPATPTNITATALSNGVIGVNWTNNAFNATGYTIQRSDDGGVTWTTLSSTLSANTESYQDISTLPGTSYLYQVQANGTNDSGSTQSAFVTMATATTTPASKLTFTPGTLPTGVTWDATKNMMTLSNSTAQTNIPLTITAPNSVWTLTTSSTTASTSLSGKLARGTFSGTLEIGRGAKSGTIEFKDQNGTLVGSITLVVN